MENKNWINHWLCAPDFADMKVRDMLHKQLDSSFELEPHEESLKNYHTLFRKKLMSTIRSNISWILRRMIIISYISMGSM